MSTTLNTFSFRAECSVDVRRLMAALTAAGFAASAEQSPIAAALGPDVGVELQSNATLEQLRGIARGVEDAHVIVQTLRQVALTENSLERDLAAA